jgi:glycosyltransferase involved in cell wall biosynthesis
LAGNDLARPARRPRVAHVNVARGYRGGERQTELLVRGLAERGIEQVLVARKGATLAARLGDTAVEVRGVRGGPIGTCLATRGVDVVHVHEGRSIYGAYLRSLVSGTPYIATRRVDKRIGNHYFAHRAYRRAACVVALSPQVAAILHAFDRAINVRVVPSSTSGLTSDPVRVAAIRSQLPGRFVVGHVGALDTQKGQEFILDVARRFKVTRPEVCFVLVGGGEHEVELKAVAKALGNVVLTGFVDNVGDYLAAFDVFAFPSRGEGLGSILLDAMEFGLPIVATAVGGVPSIVRDGENGILVQPESPTELARGIERLIDSAALRSSMGDAGKRISADYTAEQMCARYLALYHAIAGDAAVEHRAA